MLQLLLEHLVRGNRLRFRERETTGYKPESERERVENERGSGASWRGWSPRTGASTPPGAPGTCRETRGHEPYDAWRDTTAYEPHNAWRETTGYEPEIESESESDSEVNSESEGGSEGGSRSEWESESESEALLGAGGHHVQVFQLLLEHLKSEGDNRLRAREQE